MMFSAFPDFLRIDAEQPLREPLTARLERYIIADDVALEDITDQECLFHLIPFQFFTQFPGVEIRLSNRFGKSGFDVIAPRGEHAGVSPIHL